MIRPDFENLVDSGKIRHNAEQNINFPFMIRMLQVMAKLG
jgi:hypothetical protein